MHPAVGKGFLQHGHQVEEPVVSDTVCGTSGRSWVALPEFPHLSVHYSHSWKIMVVLSFEWMYNSVLSGRTGVFFVSSDYCFQLVTTEIAELLRLEKTPEIIKSSLWPMVDKVDLVNQTMAQSAMSSQILSNHQGWCLHHFLGQSILMVNNPFHE